MVYRQLNSVSFALPARQFEICASVTVNETLPKVNEFVLRLIKICGGTSAEEIGQYFDFSGKETRLLLEALADQSLIRMDGETVQLTEYAESKFYTDDDIPRFSVVKPRTDIIDFDLLTFHPIDGRIGKKSAAFLVEIPCENIRVGSSARLAEQAYQKHFKRILRDKENTKDDIDIYKISSVKSRKIFEIPVEVRFSLSNHYEVERVVEHDDDATEELRLDIEAAISDVLQTTESEQADWLFEFAEYFNDTVLKNYLSSNGFNFESYVREVIDQASTKYAEGTIPLLGNIYMPKNQEQVLSQLASALRSTCGGANLNPLVWLAPDYQFWGRTALLDDFYTSVEKSLPQPINPRKGSATGLHLLYPGLNETKWILERQLWSVPHKKVHFYSGNTMGGRVEVLLLPASFACVLFHFRPPGNSMALVPMGFMTTDIELIEKAKHLIGRATGYGDDYVGPANFDKTKQSRETPFAEQFSFLNYSPIHKRATARLFGLVDRSQEKAHDNSSVKRSLHSHRPQVKLRASDTKQSRNTPNIQGTRPTSGTRMAAIEETDDYVIFRGGVKGEHLFKISKDKKWRGLMPLPSVNKRAIEDLSIRTGLDSEQLSKTMEKISGCMKKFTPAETAAKFAAELSISPAEIWRYFIDAVFIEER